MHANAITTREIHVLGNFNENVKVWNQLLEAVNSAGVTVLGTTMHEFYPQGFTGVILLAESHVAIHTYPESDLAYVVMCTCGSNAKKLIWELERAIMATVGL